MGRHERSRKIIVVALWTTLFSLPYAWIREALMTAEDVSGLDLKGCEPAVLSARERGLGRTAGGEGGLGRVWQ